MKQTKNTAFTLVELIVVITILAVLATVAFISFQGYTSSSRDSVRLADLKNISKSFELIKTKNQKLPLPDRKIDITVSGTIFQYQGVLEEKTLKLANIHNGGLDPLSGEPYGYSVNTQRNKFQVIGFLENSQTAGNTIFSQSFADNSDKFTKTSGDNIGILLDSTTNEIITQSGSINDIEIINSATDYVLVMNSNTQGNIQSSNIVSQFLPNGSCLKLLEAGNTQSGVYTIYPDGVTAMEVYCDMQTNGGGWTYIITQNTSSPFYLQHDAFWNENYSGPNLITGGVSQTSTGFYQSYNSLTFNEISVLSHGGNYSHFTMLPGYTNKSFYQIVADEIEKKGISLSNLLVLNRATKIATLKKTHKVNTHNCGTTYGAGNALYAVFTHDTGLSHQAILHMHNSYFSWPRSSIIFGGQSGRALGFRNDSEYGQGNLHCREYNNASHWDPNTYLTIMVR